jgi:hypothetical protein
MSLRASCLRFDRFAVSLSCAALLYVLTSAPALAASKTPASKSSDDPAALVSLRLVPGDRTLSGKNASQQYLLIGTLADGRETDLTSEAEFKLSNAKPARVDAAGRVFALADGTAELSASARGHTARAALRIEGSVDRRGWRLPSPLGRVRRRDEAAHQPRSS